MAVCFISKRSIAVSLSRKKILISGEIVLPKVKVKKICTGTCQFKTFIMLDGLSILLYMNYIEKII